MDIGLLLGLLFMGACGGFAAGLLGIGGGMVLVPFVVMIFNAKHFPPELVIHMAIATSLATILFTSLSSVRAHHAHGAVLWAVAWRLTPGLLLGSWIGPWLGQCMNASVLALVFAVFVVGAATQMLVNRRPAAARQLPAAAGMLGAGAVIGIIAGLVGAGGAFISVPFMSWCNVKIHNAVATSAALGFPIALAGTLSNAYFGWHAAGLPAYSFGYIYLPALLAIASASIALAPFGARLAHRTPVATLRKIFAGVLYLLAGYMFWKSFLA